MITFYDRRYNVLAQASFNGHEGLVAYDDKFNDDLKTGIATYKFTIDKTDDSISNISIGSYIRVLTFDNEKLWFEILDMEEDHDRVDFTALDAGIDLIGESVYPYEADKGYPLKHYLDRFMLDSGWDVEIPDAVATKTRKLTFEGWESASKRIRQVVGNFDCEIEYDIEERDGKPHRKVIRIKEKLGQEKDVRLEYGREISNIKRRMSIQNLATGLRGVGSDGLTLEGYQYNDGRYWTGSGAIYDSQEGQRWSRHDDVSKDGGFIMATYESEAKTQKALFDETLLQLKKRAYPEIEYEVQFNELPEDVKKGDTILVVDYTFKPALKVRGRIEEIEGSLSRKFYGEGQVVISNIEYKDTNVDERLKAIEHTLLKQTTFDPSKVPSVAHIFSSNGTVFTDEATTMLEAKVTKFDIDISEQYTYKWKRKSAKVENDDETWNATEHNGKRLHLNKQDINVQSEFICEIFKDGQLELTQSILLKDLVINKYKGATPPENAQSGDFWTDTSSGKEVLKVYVNGAWTPAISDNTQDIAEFKRAWEESNREYADKLTTVIHELESVKESEKHTRDLTGRFGDLEQAYRKILEQEKVIEGLGERQKVYELTLEQSSAVIRTLNSVFDISDDGLIIGKNNSQMKMVLNNDRLEFLDGGRLTAYMTGQKLFIVSGAFWQSVNIGNHIFEKFGDEFTIVSYAGGAVK